MIADWRDAKGTPHEPFNFTPMGGNSTSPAHRHVRYTPVWALSTCGRADEIEKPPPFGKRYRSCFVIRDGGLHVHDGAATTLGTRRKPFNFTPTGANPVYAPLAVQLQSLTMGVNSTSPARLHVPRAHMGVHRTCR